MYKRQVLYRTPVFIYEYVVYVPGAGENGDGWDEVNNRLAISVPNKPSYIQMSVDDFNSFVDVYNGMADEATDGGTYTAMKKLEEGSKDVYKRQIPG